MVDSLFESSHTFIFMLKQFLNTLIITSFPVRLPTDFQLFIFAYKVLMYIFEMESICTILWDILKMAIYVMDCLTSVWIVFAELATVDKGKIWGYLGIDMEPNINESV